MDKQWEYNEDVKEKFLDLYPENTRYTYFQILKNVQRKEIIYKKDISQFKIDEIEELIKSFQLSTFNSVRLYAQTIKIYINFCQELDLISDNCLNGVFSSEWIRKFIVPSKKFISEEKLHHIVDNCVNAQDAMLLLLIFEGVYGYKKSEILNLTFSDVNVNDCSLKLTDSKGIPRTINVSKKCIEYIVKAYEEKIYISFNDKSNSRRMEKKLVKTEYVFQNSNVGKKRGDGKVGISVIHTRFNNLANVHPDLQSEPLFLRHSGMIALAKKIYLKYGRIVEEIALDEITKKFNVKMQLQHNGKFYHSQSLKEFVNAEVIYNVYGIHFDEEMIPFELVDETLKEKVDTHESKAVQRTRQYCFREDITLNYNDMCAITKEGTLETLEAAHIQGYINENSHHPQNGILLRVDLHRLFDKGLITITDDYKVLVSYKIHSEYYQEFSGKKINLPINKNYMPSLKALNHHREKFKDNFFSKDMV